MISNGHYRNVVKTLRRNYNNQLRNEANNTQHQDAIARNAAWKSTAFLRY